MLLVPASGHGAGRARLFGDVAIVSFLVAQALDGILTYVGVLAFGPAIEANPLIRTLMVSVGDAPGLALAKGTAVGFGMILHLSDVHRAVAALACFYFVAAIVPWTGLLFF